MPGLDLRALLLLASPPQSLLWDLSLVAGCWVYPEAQIWEPWLLERPSGVWLALLHGLPSLASVSPAAALIPLSGCLIAIIDLACPKLRPLTPAHPVVFPS